MEAETQRLKTSNLKIKTSKTSKTQIPKYSKTSKRKNLKNRKLKKLKTSQFKIRLKLVVHPKFVAILSSSIFFGYQRRLVDSPVRLCWSPPGVRARCFAHGARRVRWRKGGSERGPRFAREAIRAGSVPERFTQPARYITTLAAALSFFHPCPSPFPSFVSSMSFSLSIGALSRGTRSELPLCLCVIHSIGQSAALGTLECPPYHKPL